MLSQVDTEPSTFTRVVPQQIICCKLGSVKMMKWNKISDHKDQFVYPLLEMVQLIDATESNDASIITSYDRKK